ncbi:MAG: hypothetical protein AAB879_01010 [Patescibacteria group bacterium]
MGRHFITVVPSIRSIPGVEEFDYAIPSNANIQIGDVIHVPFRSKCVPGIVVAIRETSMHADRAIFLDDPHVLLRLPPATVALLRETSMRCFSSLPSVFHSWIRQAPKRIEKRLTSRPHAGMVGRRSRQMSLPHTHERFFVDRWGGKNGLIVEAKKSDGRVLILTPWKARADHLAIILKTKSLHADLAMTAGWNRVSGFVTGENRILVATRMGAWLSSVADTVLIDEPENDDYKQDELAPRYDARWMVECSARLRPDVRVVSYGTTPRLGAAIHASSVPEIHAAIAIEQWRKRSGSSIELLSPNTVQEIESAVADGIAVSILHPIRGMRSRVSCSDCRWSASCPACGWNLSLGERHTLCKRCGKKADLPLSCPSCGGTDFSRGLPGMDQLQKRCDAHFGHDRVRVVDLLGFESDARSLVVITDLSLLAGATEDIRRRERLIIAWRRVAAACATMDARLRVQGSEELVAECRSWLTVDGFSAAWKKEYLERRTFGFPPAVRLVKFLCDGTMDSAHTVVRDLRAFATGEWSVNGPYPVPYRSTTRKPRYVMHLIGPLSSAPPVSRLSTTLCHIDLDPIAFFE